MDFFGIIMFLVSIPSYIVDFVQLWEWTATYLRSKKKAKGTSHKANATNTKRR